MVAKKVVDPIIRREVTLKVERYFKYDLWALDKLFQDAITDEIDLNGEIPDSVTIYIDGGFLSEIT